MGEGHGESQPDLRKFSILLKDPSWELHMGGWQGIWVHHRCGKEEILLPAGGDDVIVAQDAIRVPCVDATASLTIQSKKVLAVAALSVAKNFAGMRTLRSL